MNARVTAGWAAFGLMLGLCAPAGVQAREVGIYELPRDAKVDQRAGWKAADAGGQFATGAALDNGKLVVMAAPGSGGVVMYGRQGLSKTPVELRLTGAGGKSAVTAVKAVRTDGGGASLLVETGDGTGEIGLAYGQAYVSVKAVKGLSSVLVKARSRYAILPDFFGDDAMYDPARLKAPAVRLPAESMLVNLLEGRNAMVVCLWQGALSGKDGAAASSGRDPQVGIELDGEGAQRRIEGSRIEFANTPVYVALLEASGIWHEEDVRSWKAQFPTAVEWKRPFEAEWRGNHVVAEGKIVKDWFTKSQSFKVLYPGETPQEGSPSEDSGDKKKYWASGVPERGWQGLSHFIWPNWFDGEKTYIALYADKAHRGDTRDLNKAEFKKAEAARARGEKCLPAVTPVEANSYEKVVIYPLRRNAETRLDVFTPDELMADCLGKQVCEYVLDIEGVTMRRYGGKLMLPGAVATCSLWDNYVFKLATKAQGKNGLSDEERRTLARALEEMKVFIRAVNDRLAEYRKFGAEVKDCCGKAGAASPKVKEAAKPVVAAADRLVDNVLSQKTMDGFVKSLEEWNAKLDGLVAEVGKKDYANVKTAGGIRVYAENQDVAMSTCRRLAKGIHQEVSMIPSDDPAVAEFALKVRGLCRSILRNPTHMEGF